MALEDKEVPTGTEPAPHVVARIQAKVVDGRLPCAAAFAIAEALDVAALDIGQAADRMGIRLSRCQLGFFGYPNKQAWDQADFEAMPVPAGLTDAMQEARDNGDDVSCAELWRLAAAFGVSRLQIGFLADELGIHVTPCQLGAF